jgi:hypothetical protein
MRALVLAVLALGVVAPSASAAYFEPGARIVSASFERREQADDQTLAAVISSDGNFVVFQTRARNLYPDGDPDPPGEYRVGGLFRTNLATGAVELVANGDRRSESDDALLFRGAQNPSVSDDGRFVAFATGESLVAADTNGNVDVYVRDMTVPTGAPGAFELISAKDGGNTPAAYAPPDPAFDFPGRNPGADTSRGTSISGDGRFVLFRTAQTVTSDLPDRLDVDTPELQLFVRDRPTKATTLITRDRTTADPVGGALGPFGISGDGSTVIWTGRNASQQSKFQLGESTNPATEHYLWRRIADGPGAETRRVTAQSDPDDPACPPSEPFIDSPSLSGPCYGPLAPGTAGGGTLQQLPAISRDGYTLSFLHDANPRGSNAGGAALDLFLTSMRSGLTRKSATVELTRDGVGLASIGAPLDGLAMSQDGRYAVVATPRTTFVLPALRQLTPPRTDAFTRELYLVDLQERTVERILRSFNGGDTNGAAFAAVSVDAQARRIVFVSGATNLFFGDANGQPDAFLVERRDAPPPEPPDAPDPEPVLELPPLPADDEDATPVPARRLGVFTQRGRRFGEIRLVVSAPARGTLTATARGRLPGSDGRPRGTARTLATRRVTVKKRSRVTVTLRLGAKNRSRLRRTSRITATADVRFTDRQGVRYERRINVAFLNSGRRR